MSGFASSFPPERQSLLGRARNRHRSGRLNGAELCSRGGGVMHGDQRSRPVRAATGFAVALRCLALAGSRVRAEDTASPGNAAAPPATPEVTVLNNHEV